MRIPTMPVLILNPADDAAFAASARAAVDSDAGGPQALQAALQRRYPRVAVRPRDLTGEPMTVWYVYRDGHWVSPQKRS
jgi:hypothetical protein